MFEYENIVKRFWLCKDIKKHSYLHNCPFAYGSHHENQAFERVYCMAR